MLTTILVPLDGSALAERALPYATALARAAGARVIVLRGVDTLRTSRPEEPDPIAELNAAVEKVRASGVAVEPSLRHVFS
jgi:nucleotide-binding universal stress UspA family protein